MATAISTIVSTVLIAAPFAFVGGWLACKALLQMRRQESPTPDLVSATPREFDPNATIQRPDGRTLLAEALEQAALRSDNAPGDASRVIQAASQAQSQSLPETQSELAHEVALLKDALVERDHTISELKAQVQDSPGMSQLPDLKRAAAASEDLSAECAALKHDNLLLNGRLHRAEADADSRFRHMVTWRERAKPVIKQCRQQRRIIQELRNQLRDTSVEDTPGVTVEIPSDDLQVLRGIGPALEKRLNSQGIYCYRQIAALSEEELIELGQSLGIGRNRTLSEDWLKQARELVSAGSTEPAESNATGAPATLES